MLAKVDWLTSGSDHLNRQALKIGYLLILNHAYIRHRHWNGLIGRIRGYFSFRYEIIYFLK